MTPDPEKQSAQSTGPGRRCLEESFTFGPRSSGSGGRPRLVQSKHFLVCFLTMRDLSEVEYRKKDGKGVVVVEKKSFN